jgi:glutamate-1-semialdehyde 2,1-aminomutase
VIEAVRRQLRLGTIYGWAHQEEATLAELLLQRYPFHEQARFTNTGSESVLHAVRLARAATGRLKVLKVEGTYHGNYDPTMVSFDPTEAEAGDPDRPRTVPMTEGITPGATADTVVFPFNDPVALERRLDEYDGEVAAVMVEPVILNMGCTVADADYFPQVRKLCDRAGAVLIFDEAKTAPKIAYGGGPAFYGVTPDITCVAKAIGGGFPIGAILASRELMKGIASNRVYHTGSFAANPVSVAASIATLRDVLTPDAYEPIFGLNDQMRLGHEEIIRANELDAHVVTAGASGAVFFRREPVRDYRDALAASSDAFLVYWYSMTVRGVIPQPFGRDDSWTVSTAHTPRDVLRILDAFHETAAALRRLN